MDDKETIIWGDCQVSPMAGLFVASGNCSEGDRNKYPLGELRELC